MPPCDEREVVIVGGGLVGTALAIALAKGGVPVTVCERRADVPELLRGELIMPAGVEVLDRLGVGARLRDVCLETEGTVLHHSAFEGGACQVDYALMPAPLPAPSTAPAALAAGDGEWRPRGLCGWRRPMYEALRAAARETEGVTFLGGFEVASVERLADRRLLLQPRDGASFAPIAARMVVAADGYSSRMRTLMGFEPYEEKQRTFVQGFVGRVRGTYARRHVHVGVHDVGAAFVFPFPDGHFRSTIEYDAERRPELATKDPLARHLQVLREALPELYADLGGDAIEPRTELQVQPGHTISLTSVVEDGFALVGDAAGCLDPFTGFGMSLGLTDAALLAEVLLAAKGDWSARSLRPYERRRQAGLVSRREATDALGYLFLDKAEGFAPLFAEKLGQRWSDREWVLPIVAAQFAGYDPVVEPSIGLRWHFMGLL